MKEEIKKTLYYLLKKITSLMIVVFVMFLFLYLFSDCFRLFLKNKEIDPNFLVVFLTAITLILSDKSSKKDKIHIHDQETVRFTKERVELVIAKLFGIMNKSQICLDTIKDIKYCLEKRLLWKDSNGILTESEDENNKNMVGAYLTMYFSPHIQDDWNDMRKKFDKISTNVATVASNYRENETLIMEQNCRGHVLSGIDGIMCESEKLNEEIELLTENMKNKLMDILIENDKTFRNKYFF